MTATDDELDCDLLYIHLLPKDKLLYKLWLNAIPAQYMSKCSELAPVLTLKEARNDINHMINNNRKIEITTYYGRMLFSDISGDFFDSYAYDLYNGRNKAKKIINELKQDELQKLVLKYHLFF